VVAVVAAGVGRVSLTPSVGVRVRVVYLPSVRRGQKSSVERVPKRKKRQKRGLRAAAHLSFALEAPRRQPEGGRRKDSLLEAQRPTRSDHEAAPPASSNCGTGACSTPRLVRATDFESTDCTPC